MIQIRKIYLEVNPELLYAEIKDFVLKQGASLDENKLETYTLPDESANFVSRGTMTFKIKNDTTRECLRAHMVGSTRSETRLILDIDEALFPQSKIDSLLDDLGFIFGNNEISPSEAEAD